MVSTATDYFRFCQMMLNGGELEGVRVLSRPTVELMASNHTFEVPMSPGRDTGYAFGLGFAVAQEPGRIGVPVSVGEFNWGGAAGTKFWIDPKEKFIGVYMVQILPHTGLHFGDTFKVLAYQTIAD
jgi:CubicO group peptidase (beta-lactamase class C family)